MPLTRRAVPIITDAAVDPEFGLGALKITPRHDLVDYEIFRRHDGLRLPPSVLDSRGRLEGDWVPPEYRGMDRDGRPLPGDRSTYPKGVGREERSVPPLSRSFRTVRCRDRTSPFNPMVRPMAPLAVPGGRRRSNRVRPNLSPERWNLTFFPVDGESPGLVHLRQIVWGHPIPCTIVIPATPSSASVESPTHCAEMRGHVADLGPGACSTPGSRAGCGRSMPSVGRRRPPISPTTIRTAYSSPAEISCSSGSLA